MESDSQLPRLAIHSATIDGLLRRFTLKRQTAACEPL